MLAQAIEAEADAFLATMKDMRLSDGRERPMLSDGRERPMLSDGHERPMRHGLGPERMIQIVKDSAFLTVITVTELTHAATSIQATYFVPFAAFVAAVFLYWIMCLAVEGLVGAAGARARAWR